MNRKVLKIVSILLLVILAVSMLSTSVFATESNSSWKDISTDIFDDAKVRKDDGGLGSSATSIVANIINIIQIVGMGVAIIMLIYMAIKYITAAPSEKAEFKKSATAYIVGAIVLFAASGILGIIKNFATNNVTAEKTSQIVIVADEEVA